MKPEEYKGKRKEVLTSEILGKGHVHRPQISEPEICPDCGGKGYWNNNVGIEEDCFKCQGTGEIY